MAPTLSDERPAEHKNVANDDVAQRAYELYETRGREPGHELDDWLKAERELSSAASDWRRPVQHDD
jgi:hypothetical protein